MGDFNIDINTAGIQLDKLDEFCNLFNPCFNLTNLIKTETCCSKNHKSTTDLFLTNRPLSFQKTRATGRSSRPDVFCKNGILRNFTKFTGKHLCQGLFFDKVAGLRPATLLKKRLWHRSFAVNFVKFLRTPFLIKHLWCLLLRWDWN